GVCLVPPFSIHPTRFQIRISICPWLVDRDEADFVRITSRLEELAREATPRDADEALAPELSPFELAEGRGLTPSFFGVPSGAWHPASDPIAHALAIEARRNAAASALLARAWRIEHGAYPDPDEAHGLLLEDPWTGGRLRYERRGAGIVVWSLGQNRRDDSA